MEPSIKRNKLATKIDMKSLKRDVENTPSTAPWGQSEGYFRSLKDSVFLIPPLTQQKTDSENRSVYCQKIEKHKKEEPAIIFIDEGGFSHDMLRTYGYSLKGKRCFGTHDWGAKGRTNEIGALLGGVLLAVSLFQTPINTAVFNAWVRQDLIPKPPPRLYFNQRYRSP